MSTRGAMVHMAYLKRALRIAATTVLEECLNHSPHDNEINEQVSVWINQARREYAAEREAKQGPGAKPLAKKFPRGCRHNHFDLRGDRMICRNCGRDVTIELSDRIAGERWQS